MNTFVPKLTPALMTALCLSSPCDAQPIPAGDDFQINTFVQGDQNRSAVGMDSSGNFVVTWISESQDGDAGGIFAQRFDASGARAGSEFQVNTTTADAQYFPSIAVESSGRFTIAWESPDGSYAGVFARTFAADATALTEEFQLNANTTFDQDEVRLAVTANGFVAVWTDLDTAQTSVRVVSVDPSTGAPTLGPEQSVAGIGRTSSPDVDSADDGSFVVVFQDMDDPASFLLGISAQRFDAGGTPLGNPFRVNTYTTGSQDSPTVAVKGNGDFVVVWSDKARAEIRMRHYSADGTPQSGERTAGVTDGSYDLRWPDAIANADDTTFILWETFNEVSPGGDFSGSGVAGRLFADNGNPIGPKIRINQDLVSSQRFPALAGNGAQRYVATWDQSSGQDGDGDSVEGRLLEPPLSLSTTTTTTTITTTTVSGPTTTSTTLPPMSCGDVNGDGRRTAVDALAALRASVGLIFCDLCLCDANGSGDVTASDALLILRAALGQPLALNCPGC
jgi:hypothetical protein